MSTISAGLTTGSALVSSGDTTGTLVFQTNGTTTAMTISTAQVVTFTNTPVISGGASVVTTTGTQTLTNKTIAFANNTFTGTLPVANGGTNNAFFTVSGPASSAKTYTFANENMSVGYRNIPLSGAAKTGSYTLDVGDVGKYIEVGSGGSIVIPNSTFSTGDVVSIVNNTTGNVTITCSISAAYKGGTNTVQSSLTLQTRGVATILFISSTSCVVNGNLA